MKNRIFWRPYLNPRDIEAFSNTWDLPLWQSELMLRRGVLPSDLELSSPLSGPSTLPDMDQAVRVIRQHLGGGHRVRVYGDYDADGVTAVAVLVRGLVAMGHGDKVDYYIPNRFDEGYGLHSEAVEVAHRDGVDLLITVDCGSSSPKAAQLASELGVGLVITDHHALPESLPVCDALVNPERQSHGDRLSGAGVALQLVRALTGDQVPDELYGIAATGTVADVVPLVGANRRLVARGLMAIRQGKVAAIDALLQAAGRPSKVVSAQDLGFVVGPRLNAAGRMGAPDAAVRLLLSDDPAWCGEQAHYLSDLNRQRQELERQILDEAWTMIPRDQKGQLYPFTVVASDRWHQGVIGIVASRLREALRRPCAVIAWSGNEGKGSARGVEGLNLIAHLRQSAHLFSALGGHPGAAGFSLPKIDLEALSAQLSLGLSPSVMDQKFLAKPFDLIIQDGATVQTLWRQLSAIEPFGRTFEPPRCLVRGRVGRVRRMGRELQHLEILIEGHTVAGVGFNLGARAATFQRGDPIRFIATLETNWFSGEARPQWRIETLDGPWPRRSVPISRGIPDPLPDRVVYIVNSDREARNVARRLGACYYSPRESLGDQLVRVEQARRGQVPLLVVSQWRPWPNLLGWADAVVWLCRPMSRMKWEEAGSLLHAQGQSWIAKSPGSSAVKRQRLEVTRSSLIRHWKGWEKGRSGLTPGRSVFMELELTPERASSGERGNLGESFLYQLDRWAADLKVPGDDVGEEEMHGMD